MVSRKRSESIKGSWRKRKREGGIGKCAHCGRAVYVGGTRHNGRLYHKVCWETTKARRR